MRNYKIKSSKDGRIELEDGTTVIIYKKNYTMKEFSNARQLVDLAQDNPNPFNIQFNHTISIGARTFIDFNIAIPKEVSCNYNGNTYIMDEKGRTLVVSNSNEGLSYIPEIYFNGKAMIKVTDLVHFNNLEDLSIFDDYSRFNKIV